ncbi:zinc finger protein 714-like isoform X2 [Leptidea sinapis]|uniref:zinc finger protein 714-like isoform X2 n=1 Tax=Leptidea sinapis TaxID=189913 RepID=UPI0021C2A0DC|nr:zinc finger protein 714-like isoform X2 [Leptidea sinapis]
MQNMYEMKNTDQQICRCCMVNRGIISLTDKYKFDTKIEVLNDILNEYFKVSLIEVEGCLVCNECASFLHSVKKFHTQVTQCEEQYKLLRFKCNDAKRKIKTLKQVSERKQIILTSAAVLQQTTACPFRHHKSWFQCFFCQKDFIEIKLLREHTSAVHKDLDIELKNLKRYPRSLQIEITNLQCRKCQLTLNDVNVMKCHFSEVHDTVIFTECIADYKINNPPFTCHLCNQEFHVFRSLTTHLNDHYANCVCDVCGKSFMNSKRLKAHKLTHETGIYPCKECGKILKTKTSKANHIEMHSKRKLKCNICDKPMKNYYDRVKHMSVIHNVTYTFKCPYCARVYNIKHYLATHIRQTHGHKNKKCNECSMAFITNNGLKKHMLVHSGERPFTCSICNKSYTRSYLLRDHIKEHASEKS